MDAAASKVSQISGDKFWDVTDFPPMVKPDYIKDEAWEQLPKYKRWMNPVQWRSACDRLGAKMSRKEAEVLFGAIAGGAGFVEKFKVDEALSAWGGGAGGAYNPGAFQASLFRARFAVSFGYWFLYLFAPFATYFFFLRPPLKIFLGVDLLPGLPEFWAR